jgi:hypothetical protein
MRGPSLRLRDGQAIHIVTALLLQLVQSCAHSVSQQIRGRRLRDESRMIVDGQPDEMADLPQRSSEAEKEVGPPFFARIASFLPTHQCLPSCVFPGGSDIRRIVRSSRSHRQVDRYLFDRLVRVCCASEPLSDPLAVS